MKSNEPAHFLASNLRGFRSTALRVVVERAEGSLRWVRTADLLDAGTPLVLDAAQLAPIAGATALRHTSGLVAIGSEVGA